MRCTPYKHPAHDIVKALSEITIFVVLLSVMLMKPSLVSKKLDLLGDATVGAVLTLSVLVVICTVRAARQLISEIREEIKGLDARAMQSISNPMAATSELSMPLAQDDDEDPED